MFLTILSWVCPFIGTAGLLFLLEQGIKQFKYDKTSNPIYNEREEPKQ